MKTATRKASRTTKATDKLAVSRAYAGKPIEATKVFRKEMEGFGARTHNRCKAETWIILHEQRKTVTYANSYNDVLKASFNPEHYTYPIKEKVVAAKMEAMQEVEVTEWPEWITSAAPRRSCKNK